MRDPDKFTTENWVCLGLLIGTIAFVVGIVIYNTYMSSEPDGQVKDSREYSGKLQRIIDGDTIFMDHVGSIRLALVDAPERNQSGFIESKNYWNIHCPVGSDITVIEDAHQTRSYGRVVGVVDCGGLNMNAELVKAGMADLVPRYCNHAWYLEWSYDLGCWAELQRQGRATDHD